MSRCLVTDISDLLDVDGQPVNGPTGRLARYLGLIIEAGSIMSEGEGGYVPMRCANPTRKRPCNAQLTASPTFQDHIEFECPSCGEQGLIVNWQGTCFDLTDAPELSHHPEHRDVVVQLDELDTMRRFGGLSPRLRRLLVEAASIGNNYLFFLAGHHELVQLREAARGAADRHKSGERRLLDRFCARMDAFITTLSSSISDEEQRSYQLLN